MFKKIINRIPFLESLRSFLDQWGIWGWLVTLWWLFLATGVSAWAWLTSNLPQWAVFLVFLATLTLLLFSFNFAIDFYRKVTAERLDHDAIGGDLTRLSEDMLRFINDHIRERTMHQVRNESKQDDAAGIRIVDWQRARQEGDLLVKNVVERFGHKIMASVMLLSRLDVNLPFHLSHMSEHNVMAIASYFGAVGQLIKSGNLSVAQKLDDHTKWNLSNIVG